METRCCKVLFPNCTMTMEARCCKVSFHTVEKINRLKILSYRCMGKTGKKQMFKYTPGILSIICSRGCTRRNLCSHVETCQHADRKQLTRRQAIDLDIELTHGHPDSCRARPVKVDDGLEDIRWVRRLGTEKLPATPDALLANLKEGVFFAIGEGSRFFVNCFLHSSAQRCLYQTPGRCPPRITGRFVNTVTRGWVGAPNERTSFRFHGKVVGFVDRCLSTTRNLGASS